MRKFQRGKNSCVTRPFYERYGFHSVYGFLVSPPFFMNHSNFWLLPCEINTWNISRSTTILENCNCDLRLTQLNSIHHTKLTEKKRIFSNRKKNDKRTWNAYLILRYDLQVQVTLISSTSCSCFFKRKVVERLLFQKKKRREIVKLLSLL